MAMSSAHAPASAPSPPARCRPPLSARRRARPLAAGLVLGLLALSATGAPPGPASAAVAPAEGAGLPAATAVARTRAPAPRPRYGWPTGAPAEVVQGFDPPAVVWGSGHRGVDLALAAGSPVLAAGAGTVAFAGPVAGRPVVSIDHADGIRTTYEPVEASVAVGDAVARGQVIGTLVAGHRSDGVDALHWGARTGPKSYVNPLRLVQPAVIRLKPLEARRARPGRRVGEEPADGTGGRSRREEPAQARGKAWAYTDRRRSVDTWV